MLGIGAATCYQRAMHDARIDALARQLVRYSTALKKGEKVLIDLHDVPDAIGLALIREARAKGALPFLRVQQGPPDPRDAQRRG